MDYLSLSLILLLALSVLYAGDAFSNRFSRQLSMRSSEYDAIKDLEVYDSTGKYVKVGGLWRDNDRSIVLLFRSFG